MKNKYKILTVLLYALSILLPNACTKNYVELNTDPKTVSADIIDPGLLLTNVEWNGVVANGSYGNGSYGCFCGMCKRDDDAPFNDQDAPGMWNFSYETMVNNLSNIVQLIDGKTNKDELVNKQAIARILRAWAFANLTDTYGDVPYSESCLPQEQAIFSPKYDTQQSIYTDLFKELKEAVAQLDEAKVSYGSADLIYGGDVVKWRKLGNSLRLRLALRIRYADATLAQQQLSELAENDLITTLSDDAFILNNTDFPEHLNPRYYRIVNYSTTQESVWTHQVMIDLLKNDSINYDPRIKLYADTVMAPFKGGISPHGYYFPPYKYRGSPTLGLVTVNYKYPWGSNTVSAISDFWRVPVIAPALMRTSEVYFSLAEAKLAGILPAGFSGSAEQYYQKGIDASIDWYKWFYDLTAPQMPTLMLDYIHNIAYSPENHGQMQMYSNFLIIKRLRMLRLLTSKVRQCIRCPELRMSSLKKSLIKRL